MSDLSSSLSSNDQFTCSPDKKYNFSLMQRKLLYVLLAFHLMEMKQFLHIINFSVSNQSHFFMFNQIFFLSFTAGYNIREYN
jgi:hypothetical protein